MTVWFIIVGYFVIGFILGWALLRFAYEDDDKLDGGDAGWFFGLLFAWPIIGPIIGICLLVSACEEAETNPFMWVVAKVGNKEIKK